MATMKGNPRVTRLRIPAGPNFIDADLTVPEEAKGLVIFAHGSGSGRGSLRNRQVGGNLVSGGFATLLMDLLTPEERDRDEATEEYRFNLAFLAERLIEATEWVTWNRETEILKVGFFGAGTGAAAALIAASELPSLVSAVVSRGGLPDLAGEILPKVRAATLLIVGGKDESCLTMNRSAFGRLTCEKNLEMIPGATHLFEEPGALEEVSRLGMEWFHTHLG